MFNPDAEPENIGHSRRTKAIFCFILIASVTTLFVIGTEISQMMHDMPTMDIVPVVNGNTSTETAIKTITLITGERYNVGSYDTLMATDISNMRFTVLHLTPSSGAVTAYELTLYSTNSLFMVGDTKFKVSKWSVSEVTLEILE